MALTYDYGAVAKTFKLNTNSLNQSKSAAKVGMGNLGIHMEIGIDGSDAFNTAWMEKVRDIYTSAAAVANNRLLSSYPYTQKELSAYLMFCFYLDSAMAEARRDLTMIRWRDVYTVEALADYWGPNWSSVVQTAVAAGTQPYFEWNSLATRIAAEFPHPHIKVMEDWAYLLGNIFQDDNKGRWEYLYPHYHNTSFADQTPTFDQALTAAKSMLSTWDTMIGISSVTTLTTDKLASIRADLLNIFGSGLDRDYGVIMDMHSAPQPVYDPLLIEQLSNWQLGPRAIYWQNALPNNGRLESAADRVFSSASSLALDAIMQSLPTWTNAIRAGFKFTFSNSSSVAAMDSVIIDFFINKKWHEVPWRVTGTKFEGDAALAMAEFHEYIGLVNSSSILGYNEYSVEFNSYTGFTVGKVWANELNPLTGVILLSWVTPSIIISAPFGTGSWAIPAQVVCGAKLLNTADFGNFLMYFTGSVTNYTPLGVQTLAESVDEWAEISNPTLMSYLEAVTKGLFDVGIVVGRSYNKQTKIARDNRLKVTTPLNSKRETNNRRESGSDNQDRFDKRSDRKKR